MSGLKIRVVKGCSKNSFRRVESYSFIEIEFRKIKKKFDKIRFFRKFSYSYRKEIFFSKIYRKIRSKSAIYRK